MNYMTLRQQRDELYNALLELYRWCNNVEIRGEGLHRGPIWFGGPAISGERTEEDDQRFDAMAAADKTLHRVKRNAPSEALIADLLDNLEDREDMEDGENGPIPGDEMILKQRVIEAFGDPRRKK